MDVYSKFEKSPQLVFDPRCDNKELLDELRRRCIARGVNGSVPITSLLSVSERDEIGERSISALFWQTVVKSRAWAQRRFKSRGGKRGGRQRIQPIFDAAWHLARIDDSLQAKEAWAQVSGGGVARKFKLRWLEEGDKRKLSAEGYAGGITFDTFREYWHDVKQHSAR